MKWVVYVAINEVKICIILQERRGLAATQHVWRANRPSEKIKLTLLLVCCSKLLAVRAHVEANCENGRIGAVVDPQRPASAMLQIKKMQWLHMVYTSTSEDGSCQINKSFVDAAMLNAQMWRQSRHRNMSFKSMRSLAPLMADGRFGEACNRSTDTLMATLFPSHVRQRGHLNICECHR